jgi:hypothetical protein
MSAHVSNIRPLLVFFSASRLSEIVDNEKDLRFSVALRFDAHSCNKASR